MTNSSVQQGSAKVVVIGVSLALFRFLPANTYNSFMNWQLGWLGKDTLRFHAPNLVECIKLSKNVSAGYKNTNDEVNSLLKRMTLLQPYLMRVYPLVTAHRRRSGLKV